MQAQPRVSLPSAVVVRSLTPPDAPLPPPTQAPPKGGSVPDSPLQLLRYLTSDAHKASQRELWRKVRESYEVRAGWGCSGGAWAYTCTRAQHSAVPCCGRGGVLWAWWSAVQ